MKAIALLYVGMGVISKAIRKPIQKFSVAAVFRAANGHSYSASRQAETAGWLFRLAKVGLFAIYSLLRDVEVC